MAKEDLIAKLEVENLSLKLENRALWRELRRMAKREGKKEIGELFRKLRKRQFPLSSMEICNN